MQTPKYISPHISPRRGWAAAVTVGVLLLAAGQQRTFAQVEHDRDPEAMVSLSAAAITEILRREPGLLLEVKRLLVRKAYEQGRLLDPADLTDDALFQLLREDDKIRVLATLEVERREYVRPKPTRQEMAKGRIERLPAPEPSKASGSGAAAEAQSEEEKYWAQHELPGAPEPSTALRASVVNDGFSNGGFAEPDPAAPPQDASPAQSTAPPYPDIRRRQSLAGVQPLGRDSYQGAPPETGSLPRIGLEGLPELLSASLDESSSSVMGQKPGSMDATSGQPYASASSRFRENSAGQPSSSFLSPAGAGFSNWNSRAESQLQPQQLQAGDAGRPAIRRRVNPYAGVPSLYDLYAQVSRRSPVLARFGEDVFRDGTGNFDELPMDLPVGPDYVLGPGDGLSIELWGGVSQHLQRVVDREGRVALPEAGAVEVTAAGAECIARRVSRRARRRFSRPSSYGAGLRCRGRAAAGCV